MQKFFVLPQLTISILADETVEYRYKGGKKIYISSSEWEQIARDSIAYIAFIRNTNAKIK